MYQDFDKLIGEKSAVYISHRLSSTQFCDHVAMFQEGEMVEYGTHQELLGQDGAYAEMFRIQAQYYVTATRKTDIGTCANGHLTTANQSEISKADFGSQENPQEVAEHE